MVVRRSFWMARYSVSKGVRWREACSVSARRMLSLRWARRSGWVRAVRSAWEADVGPEDLHDVVGEVAALAAVEAGLGGFWLDGEEAALGEGTEGAGGLEFKDVGTAGEGAFGEWGEGEVVGEGLVGGEGEWGGLDIEEREGKGAEEGGGAAGAFGGSGGVADDDGGCGSGDAAGEGGGGEGIGGGVWRRGRGVGLAGCGR